ncbi:hypothetical protein J2S37_000351 [Corynebacterium felinum]|uniref:Uncharacterized protein n=1 Tax=Corynebacterium felinum TaxID=131318 RepID=A0ABU2B5C5_9CORY|nr:hypothetical protein [Corynebacterium felinum]
MQRYVVVWDHQNHADLKHVQACMFRFTCFRGLQLTERNLQPYMPMGTEVGL